jgi:beta-galactosidase
MKPITFDATCYRAGEEPLYMLSGEFHYFRVPRADWRRRMQLFKEAGGNCLATYIPWLLHEPLEGQFRFSGEDWLELEAFLQTAVEEDLYVIARPGPYQYSELVYHGLPGWLVTDYPQVLAQTAKGGTIGYASVSYTHPLFLEKVRTWFDAVLPILARYTIEQGGPIAFVQIDNELVGIHEWFGSLDYHPETMGIGKPGGAFPAFLQKRYGTLEALNAARESACTDFSEAKPIPLPEASPAAALRSKKDYFDFYLSTIADYAGILTGFIRAHGIQTPIMHNSGNPGMNAYFLETVERLGSQFLLGSDHYYNLDQNWAQNHPTPQYAAKSFLSLEMLRLLGSPPSVLEIPGGSASHWPPVLPGDALAAYMSNLAFGMKGSNYYIFTCGPNPPGAGQNTDLYDYGAGISAEGEIRPLYQAQKTFGQFVQAHPGWLTARRASDFRIGLDFEIFRSEQYWNERGPYLFSNVDAARFLRTGVLTTALCASLSHEFVNLDSDDWTADTSTPLVIVSSTAMHAHKQRRIIDFLKQGGKVVIAPVLPSLDENLQPCADLAHFLGSPQQSANTAGLARPRVGEVINVFGTVFPFTQVPEGAQITGVDEFSGQPIALTIDTAGGGQAVLLGMHWVHGMREQERMLSEQLSRLGLLQAVVCDNPNLWAVLYTGAGRPTIFLLNLFTEPIEARVQVRLTPDAAPTDLGHLRVEPVTVRALDLT